MKKFRSKFFVILFLLSLSLSDVISKILLYDENTTDFSEEKALKTIRPLTMLYASPLPKNEQMGYIDEAEPSDACDEVRPPPPADGLKKRYKRFALLSSNNGEDCDYKIKLENVKKAGYDGMIYQANQKSGDLQSKTEDWKEIPVIYITLDDTDLIKNFTSKLGFIARFSENNYNATNFYSDTRPFIWWSIGWPIFCLIVSCSFLYFIIFFIRKYYVI